MTAYRVYFTRTDEDCIIVEADTPDGAYVTAYEEVRRTADFVEIQEIEEA